MIRGSRILTEDPVKAVNEYIKIQKKGRNLDLIKKRNTVILYRYYMYKNFSKWGYEQIIETISEEIYLSTRTVTDILTANLQELRQITSEKPDLRVLDKQFPHYDWSIRAVDSK
jgi:hypothetical protein